MAVMMSAVVMVMRLVAVVVVVESRQDERMRKNSRGEGEVDRRQVNV